MSSSTVFTIKRSQAVHLPADLRFPDHVTKVHVRMVGADRVISPINQSWDSFFHPEQANAQVTDDFLADWTAQSQPDREALCSGPSMLKLLLD